MPRRACKDTRPSVSNRLLMRLRRACRLSYQVRLTARASPPPRRSPRRRDGPPGPCAADAPTADAPTADAPTADAPTADAPTADAPTADAPTARLYEGVRKASSFTRTRYQPVSISAKDKKRQAETLTSGACGEREAGEARARRSRYDNRSSQRSSISPVNPRLSGMRVLT